MSTEEQYQSLERRMIDASFSTGPYIPVALAGIPMAPDRFVCCVPEGHWAAQRASVKLAMLAEENFVVFIREYLPGGYGRLLTMCMRAGFRPREGAHVRQWITAAMLVSFGEGIAIVPAALRRANIERVCYVPLEGEDMQTSGNFIWNPEAMSPALHALIDTVRAHL
jgi:DNA-binding transcriptional LysR family regulator